MRRNSRPTLDLSSANGTIAQAAQDIGDRLLSTAIWSDSRCTWCGPDVQGETGQWTTVYRTVDESIYGGLSGIAIFLAELGAITGCEDYRDAAVASLRQVAHQLQNRPQVTDHGFYSGLAGVVWAVQYVSTVTGVSVSLPTSFQVKVMEQNANSLCDVDLLDGLAGTLSGLLLLKELRDESDVLNQCETIARRIVSLANKDSGVGMSWRSSAQTTEGHDLCGLAHGASGAALALLELNALLSARFDDGTDNQREALQNKLVQVAFESFRYERQWFCRKAGGWPDLRSNQEIGHTSESALSYPCYWCHGAAGIGLSRLRAYELTGHSATLAEAGAALANCRQHARKLLAIHARGESDFDCNVSLCHGLGSVLDALLYSHQLLGIEDDRDLAVNLAISAINHASTTGTWQCGLINSGESPGLLLGISGFGLILLRMYSNDAYQPVGLPMGLATLAHDLEISKSRI